MKVTKDQLALLATYGFQWYKSQCTDSVDAEVIDKVIPAANGFTVVYKQPTPERPVMLRYSTATVDRIELPPGCDYANKWIRVYWLTIEDERNN